MYPKYQATVAAPYRKVADDLAAAKAAHAAADHLEDQYRQQNDAARAAAQKAVQDAKDKAARDAEKRLAKIDAELGGKMAAAEADVAAARKSAMAEIERSEEHTSELQSLMRISYAVFCLKKTKNQKQDTVAQESTK